MSCFPHFNTLFAFGFILWFWFRVKRLSWGVIEYSSFLLVQSYKDPPQCWFCFISLFYYHHFIKSLFHKIHSAPGYMLKRPIYLWRPSPLLFQIRSRSFKTIIESILKCISISLLASVFNLLQFQACFSEAVTKVHNTEADCIKNSSISVLNV